MSSNGHTPSVDPQTVIERLCQQIAQMSFSLAMKDAYIADLEARLSAPTEEVMEDAGT